MTHYPKVSGLIPLELKTFCHMLDECSTIASKVARSRALLLSVSWQIHLMTSLNFKRLQIWSGGWTLKMHKFRSFNQVRASHVVYVFLSFEIVMTSLVAKKNYHIKYVSRSNTQGETDCCWILWFYYVFMWIELVMKAHLK